MRRRNEPLVVGATTESPEEAEIPQSPSASKAWSHSGRIDFTRLDGSLRLLLVTTLALFIALQLPWYTFHIDRPKGPATGSASAMAAGGWRYLIWSLTLLTLVYLFLESVTSWKRPSWLRRYEVLLGVAVLDLVLVLVAGLAAKGVPPHPKGFPVPDGALGTSSGAWVALIAAIAALGAAAAGRGESGGLRLADLRPHLAGVRVQSPFTGVRSPIIRERPAGSAPAALGAPVAAELPPANATDWAAAPVDDRDESPAAAMPPDEPLGAVVETGDDVAPVEAVEGPTAADRLRATLAKAGPRLGTAKAGFKRAFGLERRPAAEPVTPVGTVAEDGAYTGAGEHGAYEDGAGYPAEQSWDGEAYPATEEWSGEYAGEWQAEQPVTQYEQAGEWAPAESYEYAEQPPAYEYGDQPAEAYYYPPDGEVAPVGEEHQAEVYYEAAGAPDEAAQGVAVAGAEGEHHAVWDAPSPPPAPSL